MESTQVTAKSHDSGACPDSPGRLWSLWGLMNKFPVFQFAQMCGQLNYIEGLYRFNRSERGGLVVSDEQLKSAQDVVGSALKLAKSIGFTDCTDTIFQCQLHLDDGNKPIVAATVLSEIQHTENALRGAAFDRAFLCVSKQRSGFVDAASLFGPEVYTAFPSARFDITEAGNCLAAECNTAAVFHLMRAIEWGMRAFGAHLGVTKLKSKRKNGKLRLTPVSYSDWEHILNGIQGAADAKIAKLRRGEAKQKAQEFYYAVLQDLRGVRDAWRNHVMHTRREYSSHEAIAIKDRVERVMQLLATKVKEA